MPQTGPCTCGQTSIVPCPTRLAGTAKTSSVLWGSPVPSTGAKSGPSGTGGGRPRPTLTQSYVVHLVPSYTHMLTRLQDALFRTLNLNSPGPLSPIGPPQTKESLSVSPDVSPVSTTSALLTPPELSPAKPYGDWKFNPSYDFGSAYQPQSNNALLFETDPQSRYQDIVGSAAYRPSVVQSADPFRPSSRAFPAFEPSSEQSPYPSMEAFSRMDGEPRLRQDPSMLHPSWSHQRLRSSSSEWTKGDDRRGFESYGPSEITASPSHGSRSHAAAHEVGICVLFCVWKPTDHSLLAHKLPHPLASFSQPSLPPFCLAHYQVIGSASVDLPSAEAQDCRHRRASEDC